MFGSTRQISCASSPRLSRVTPIAFYFINAISFALGTISTPSLLWLMQRIVMHRCNRSGPESRETKYEIEELEGVNTSLAERFADIGLTTFQGLAYEDPIKLIMRMNLRVRVVTDLISQALSALYLGNLKTYRRYVLGSIQDVSILYDHLKDDKHPDLQRLARSVLEALASDLNLSPEVLEHMFYEVESDRGARFLRKSAAMQATTDAPPSSCGNTDQRTA
jgi:hypothetical protein